MRKLPAFFVAATLLTGVASLPGTARADLVLFNNGNGSATCNANCASFTDLNGSGFGAYPRLMTLQNTPTEQGLVKPDASGNTIYPSPLVNSAETGGISGVNQAIDNGQNKASSPTLTSLGWTSASQVKVGAVFNNIGNSGITLNTLTLNLYNAAGGLVDSFSLAAPITFTAADLALQPGNGNAVFSFVLNAQQQAEWNALNPQGTWRIGLASSLGCASGVTTCASNDGPDSFIAVASAGSPSLVPLPPAVLLFVSGLAGLGVLARRRKSPAAELAV